MLKFQSTPPHGRRLLGLLIHRKVLAVSIHAPTWEATLGLFPLPTPCEVSIHAPAREGRRGYPSSPIHHSMFQSTPPHGRRLRKNPDMDGRPAVSIHAPTRGATYPLIIRLCKFGVSIHAPTWEATLGDLGYANGWYWFQSTPPTWEATVPTHGNRCCCIVSIHAPTWERPQTGYSADKTDVFQSTPPHGRRLILFYCILY